MVLQLPAGRRRITRQPDVYAHNTAVGLRLRRFLCPQTFTLTRAPYTMEATISQKGAAVFRHKFAMNIIEREQNGITIYQVEGRIDSAGAEDLDDTLQAAAAEGKHKMVLDMAQVQYINSAALRTLADIITQNREAGGDLRLAALPPKVKRVLQIVGFDRFSALYTTVEEALTDF